ncbi:L,D-transpeptidase family protein [Alkalimarinus alittae]|uniref:L,D-transpeptidase family protein n=1 Tax=Alkalimarinus alittae TaxID=2961619 RepID=A0ABY6MYX2_9ALTE|nr:L,D-transpeptidase family protein [Alkalimarinus alittae]UZE95052.1 L,D-transpeptidase family protein [Alkalimarinus alittae]
MIRLISIVILACISLSLKSMELPKADLVLVKKSERKLVLVKDGEVFRRYDIALGDSPKGHKQFEGDEKTPEGTYILDWRNENSKFYRSIHISYPNEQDQQFALEQGRDPGGMIMIHGRPNKKRDPVSAWILDKMDWTDGCIAVKNEEMDEIWAAIDNGTPIEIHP